MKINIFLSVISEKELIKRIVFLDQFMKFTHMNNYYVSSDLRDIKIIIDGEKYKVDPSSVKLDLVPQESNNYQKYDILEFTALELCAFNHFVDENEELKLITESDFINSLFVDKNIEIFLENVPENLHEYYQKIYRDGEIGEYLSDYLNEKGYTQYSIDNVERKKKINPFQPFYKLDNSANINYFNIIAVMASIILLSIGIIILLIQ